MASDHRYKIADGKKQDAVLIRRDGVFKFQAVVTLQPVVFLQSRAR